MGEEEPPDEGPEVQGGSEAAPEATYSPRKDITEVNFLLGGWEGLWDCGSTGERGVIGDN